MKSVTYKLLNMITRQVSINIVQQISYWRVFNSLAYTTLKTPVGKYNTTLLNFITPALRESI